MTEISADGGSTLRYEDNLKRERFQEQNLKAFLFYFCEQ